MNTQFTILNASGKFDAVLDSLRFEVQRSLIEIEKHIELPRLDIVISPCSAEYKTPSGILGCVSTPFVIDLMLDSGHPDLLHIIKNELTAVIAHELHHAIRSNSGVQEHTLFQVLISEGLACHFETKFSNSVTSNFFGDVSVYLWPELYKKMHGALHSTDFDYPLYFGGKETAQFPNRAGYWVGFNLVSQYINKYGGCAATLINIPAERFIKE